MSESRRVKTLLGHLKATGAVTTAQATPSYRYSLDESCSGVLTAEQRQHYEDNGFIVVKDLVPQHHLDIYRDRFKQICTKQVKVSGPTPLN